MMLRNSGQDDCEDPNEDELALLAVSGIPGLHKCLQSSQPLSLSALVP